MCGKFNTVHAVYQPLCTFYSLFRHICLRKISLLLARLESAYSLFWGTLRVWRQDFVSFMISRPILHNIGNEVTNCIQ